MVNGAAPEALAKTQVQSMIPDELIGQEEAAAGDIVAAALVAKRAARASN